MGTIRITHTRHDIPPIPTTWREEMPRCSLGVSPAAARIKATMMESCGIAHHTGTVSSGNESKRVMSFRCCPSPKQHQTAFSAVQI